jgi:hypothetical protein
MKTPENFHIRPARLEDVPIILELIRDLAASEGATHEVTATEEQRLNLSCCWAKEEGPPAELFLNSVRKLQPRQRQCC